jgi:hypothetical protein
MPSGYPRRAGSKRSKWLPTTGASAVALSTEGRCPTPVGDPAAGDPLSSDQRTGEVSPAQPSQAHSPRHQTSHIRCRTSGCCSRNTRSNSSKPRLRLVGRIPARRARRQPRPAAIPSQPFQRPERRRLSRSLPTRPRTRLWVRFAHQGSLLVPFFTGRLTRRSVGVEGFIADPPTPCLERPPSVGARLAPDSALPSLCCLRGPERFLSLLAVLRTGSGTRDPDEPGDQQWRGPDTA